MKLEFEHVSFESRVGKDLLDHTNKLLSGQSTVLNTTHCAFRTIQVGFAGNVTRKIWISFTILWHEDHSQDQKQRQEGEQLHDWVRLR